MMRKIQTPEEIERKRKRNSFIVSFVLLGILLFSTIGYSFMSSDKLDGDGGSENDGSNADIGEPQQTPDGRWVINSNYGQMIIITNPELLKNMSISILAGMENYYGKEVYIDSNNSGIYSELASNLGRYASKIREACYGQCERDLPEKNCSDNIIVWRENAENKVYQNESCIFLEGDMKSADAFLYKISTGN